MEKIVTWVKELIAMVILAGCLEMLLPGNQFKNVTRMIVGLVIMSMLFRPLTELMRFPTALADSLSTNLFPTEAVSDTERIVRKGFRIREEWQVQHRMETEKKLREELQHIVDLWNDISIKQVACSYEGSRLKRIQVTVVTRGQESFNSHSRSLRNREIAQAVRMLTGLDEKWIVVRWGEAG